MTDQELDFIIEQGEGQFIEFKEKVDKSLSKGIVAFANAQGGRIFVGINDKGIKKQGIITNSLRSQIQDIARKCDPPINPNIETIDNIIIIVIEESINKPHSCSSGFFLRIGANSQKLTRDEIFEFAYNEGRKFFEEEVNKDFVYPDDFDSKKFSDYLNEASLSRKLNDEDILINLGVAKRNESKILFNNAGILFFAKNPSEFLSTSKIVCGEFAGNEKVEILDKKVYDDGILENIHQSINFIKKRIKVRYKIETAEREEIPQFPVPAFREAVVNAIMHRDYFDKSSDIFIEVYRNKLVVFNPGGLVRWMNPSDFGKVSKTRNPTIASLLSRTIYVEKMGTGIKRMQDSMVSAGLDKPIFDQNLHSFFITMNDNELSSDLEPEPAIGSEKTSEKRSEKTSEKILQLLKESPLLTIEELSEKIEVTPRSIERNIKKLQEDGLLKRIGPDRGGHWKIL